MQFQFTENSPAEFIYCDKKILRVESDCNFFFSPSSWAAAAGIWQTRIRWYEAKDSYTRANKSQKREAPTG